MVATQTPPAARGGDLRSNAAGTPAEILKSPQDKRLYRRIVLANGLEALLISDPDMAHSLAADDHQRDDEEDEDEDQGEGDDDEVHLMPAHFKDSMGSRKAFGFVKVLHGGLCVPTAVFESHVCG